MKALAWFAGSVVALVALAAVAVACGTSERPNRTDHSVVASAPATTAVTPTPAPEPAGPASEVGSGTYEVGVDIVPGRWKTAGPDQSGFMPMCYYARHRDDSGEFKSIIANDNLQGPGSVTVKRGEFLELSGSCTWTAQ